MGAGDSADMGSAALRHCRVRADADPEYAPLLKLRREAARSGIVLVEGWTPPSPA
jgi:uncharacterized protein (DUF1330 family)